MATTFSPTMLDCPVDFFALAFGCRTTTLTDFDFSFIELPFGEVFLVDRFLTVIVKIRF